MFLPKNYGVHTPTSAPRGLGLAPPCKLLDVPHALDIENM